MNDHVLKLIEKAYAEKATLLDLGNCGLTAVPKEILICASYLREINFGILHGNGSEFDEEYNPPTRGIDLSNNPTSLNILAGLPNLHTLNLDSCKIGEKGA